MDYLPDRPIEAEQEDKFNRSPFASRIATTIAHRADSSSLVVGIFGKWGEGKTSVLNLMKSALKHHDDVEVVPFNPWHFTSQEQLLRGFFATLADALDERLKTAGESIGEVLKKYGAALSVASVTFGGMVSVNPGAAASQLGANLSTVELDKLRERVERILRESGKRVVVLIDDIDRLDRQEIQAIFKLVKLSASFPSTVYVLAFDDEMVADALGERYGKGGIKAGRQFLEKIIQVPLYLPPADRASLRTLAFQGQSGRRRCRGRRPPTTCRSDWRVRLRLVRDARPRSSHSRGVAELRHRDVRGTVQKPGAAGSVAARCQGCVLADQLLGPLSSGR